METNREKELLEQFLKEMATVRAKKPKSTSIKQYVRAKLTPSQLRRIDELSRKEKE